MKLRTLTPMMLAGLVWSAPAQPQPATNPAAKPRADGNPAFARVTDVPGLPRVLLIGDSISIGYTPLVRRLLQGKANVHRIPTNGGPTTNGLACLKQWLGDDPWDVVHFNWGLHDLRIMADGKRQVPPETYEQNLRELARQLKATGARLIWASTTPVPEGKLNPPRDPADVIAYNAIARRIMEESRIAVDDLYACALPQLAKIQRPTNVHFTAEGSAVLARQVVASIEGALARKK
jgi:hypothetical protein